MIELDLPELSINRPMDLDAEFQIREVLDMDDRCAFVARTKDLLGHGFPETINLEKDVPDTSEATYCPHHVFRWVCMHDAVDCAKGLLEGYPFIVNPNVPFQFGLYPLHIAAECFSYNMVDTLLCHGAWTDVETIEGEFWGGLLPLDTALDMLSYHRYLSDWTPKQSIFKLIFILSLPQMKVPLETIKLLAWNTKDVDNIFYLYAMEGDLIPMAALLMVAREKIMARSTLQSKDSSGLEGGMIIHQFILDKISLLTDEEADLMHSNQSLKSEKEVLSIALLLLGVFDRAGDAIETYRQSVRYYTSKEMVAKDIKVLLEELGFVLKNEDMDLSYIDCESEDIKLATEVLEKRTSFRSQFQVPRMPIHSLSCYTGKQISSGSHFQDPRMPFHSLSNSFCMAKSPITNRRNERIWAVSQFIEWGSPALTPFRPYRTAKASDFDPSSFPIFRLPCDLSRDPAMKIVPSFFLCLNEFAPFALAIKRGLTRI